MVTLLSFIGTGMMRDTLYWYGEQECHTPAIQEALYTFFRPDRVVLFVTRGALQANYETVVKRLSGAPVTMVPIPDGRSESEMWEIFSAVIGSVAEHEEILFDLTHGFRTLPFIALISVAYLKEIRNISLSGVMYGAFEAGSPVTLSSGESVVRAPVFDLTGFVTLFDWMAGIRSFLRHADAGLLKQLSREVSDTAFRSSGSRDGMQPLMNLMGPLNTYAEAIRLSRPVEVMTVSSRIAPSLPAAREAIGMYTPALGPLLEKISEIEFFSDSEASGPLSCDKLKIQRAIISKQMDMGLYQQAVTLGREWMISVLIFAGGAGDNWLDRKTRMDAEDTLNGAEQLLRGGSCMDTRYAEWFCRLESWKEITGIWSSSSQLRNELAHCGMNPSGSTVQVLLKGIQSFSVNLDRFYSFLIPDLTGSHQG